MTAKSILAATALMTIIATVLSGLAIEYRPYEQQAEELFNMGIGAPWIGGNPPAWQPFYYRPPWPVFSDGIYIPDGRYAYSFGYDPMAGTSTILWDGYYGPYEGQMPLTQGGFLPSEQPPAYYGDVNVVDHTMARGVTSSGEPFGRSALFSGGDVAAYSWIKFGPVYEPHTLNWRWISPDGVLFSVSSCLIPDPKSRGLDHWFSPQYWSMLSIRGTPAQRLAGLWKVQIYLDSQLVVEESFTIR